MWEFLSRLNSPGQSNDPECLQSHSQCHLLGTVSLEAKVKANKILTDSRNSLESIEELDSIDLMCFKKSCIFTHACFVPFSIYELSLKIKSIPF